MLTYSFENTGSDSLYEHLYKCIKEDILSGRLLPDYKLPSKRSFAKNLGISTITVENAYSQLMAEGYIYSMPKRGYYVADISATGQSLALNSTADKQPHDNSSYPVSPNEAFSPAAANDDCLINFSTNHTSTANFPFYTWAKLMKEVMSDKTNELLTPSPAAGIIELRSAIAKHLYDFRGMNVLPEQIIVGAGTEYLYGLLIQLLGRDKVFAVEDPGYSKIRQIYESNNVECLCIPLDNDGILMRSLSECNADILHLSPSHHYPTGIVTPISRRYEILGWASKSDSRYIIEDDYDSEFRLLGKPIPSLQSIDVSDKVIYMNTFTKSLAPTIRISYMILPLPLMPRFNKQLGFYSCTVSNFEQYTLARFINEGHFEKHINRMRIYYRNQRDLLITAIKKSPLNSCVTIQEKDAGLHFLIKANTSLTDEELIENAKKAGLKITCLSQYYYNQSIAIHHTLVINYSALQPETIPKAVKMLCQILTSDV
ncbi:MAG: PLP-dependent aminotransferase family protein [Lachnospira sp.]|nr:PLP-dependent aminotransferase family protein [Lachnospira sp.]